MKISIINGVNMNNLGKRDAKQYGKLTLAELEQSIASKFPEVQFSFYCSNLEGALVDAIQASQTAQGIVLNAGAYTHYSYAIRDAVKDSAVPVVEVHMSNVHAREAFRHQSVLSEVCIGTIAGFGADSYMLAVRALLGKA